MDGHKFNLLGMVYLNLKLLQPDGTFYYIEYEAVFVSANIDIYIVKKLLMNAIEKLTI